MPCSNNYIVLAVKQKIASEAITIMVEQKPIFTRLPPNKTTKCITELISPQLIESVSYNCSFLIISPLKSSCRGLQMDQKYKKCPQIINFWNLITQREQLAIYYKQYFNISVSNTIIFSQMKTSTLVFFTETKKETNIYTLPTDSLIPTHECYSHSVMLSMAAYMVWKFPYLAPPAIDIPVEPKFRQETFPDRLAVTHPMHDFWVELFLQAVCGKNALRIGETLYLRIKVTLKYAKVLKQHGFIQQTINGKLSWKSICSEADQQNLRSSQSQKLVLVLTCAIVSTIRGSFNSPAILAGLFFNNENWKTFRIMNNEYPSAQDYKNATQIIVPGSALCFSINIEPNIMKLIDQLRSLFINNQKVKYLGICYGHQLLSWVFNPGSVRRASKGSFGLNQVQIISSQTTDRYSFLKDLTKINLYQVHNDEVFSVPDGFIKIGESRGCGVEMVISNDGRILTMQAHPEYTPARFRSVIALNRVYQGKVSEQQLLEIVLKENEMQDDSTKGQQIIRRFIS